jgi:hypothetical protein
MTVRICIKRAKNVELRTREHQRPAGYGHRDPPGQGTATPARTRSKATSSKPRDDYSAPNVLGEMNFPIAGLVCDQINLAIVVPCHI